MDCIVLPVSILRRRYSISRRRRLGYRPLTDDVVTVVVGKKEKREFQVDPFVLEESPFRVLLDMSRKENKGREEVNAAKRMVCLDVDAILFEHMLWLMQNDSSSLFQLNVRDIIDFYSDQES